jgi:hypothetical protein
MADATVGVPVWVDLSSADPGASRAFYASLFGWDVVVSPDPQYGGYAMARVGDQDVAGIGPTMSLEAPTAWMVYLGTPDAEDVARQVPTAGGSVIAPPFDVGEAGRMAVFEDPAGALISVWQPKAMSGFATGVPNSFGWAELNARGLEGAVPFYRKVFGWTPETRPMGEGLPPYTEFQLGGKTVAGGKEMNAIVPPEVPSYWRVFFTVDDVDRTFQKAIEAGAVRMSAPQDLPGERFAVLSDPQGAIFGLITTAAG